MTSQELDERIKQSTRPQIGIMNDVHSVQEAEDWCSGEYCTWMAIKNEYWYVEIDKGPFKQLIRDCIAEVTPEKCRDYSQDNTDEQSKKILMACQATDHDIIDTIQANTKKLLGDNL